MKTERVEPIFLGRTFDDFLFRPQYSSVSSRKEIDLSSQVCRGVSINIPLVGANMDTVTREHMARALALEGCVGVLDRGCSIHGQVSRGEFVKKQHSYLIENPITIHRRETIAKAKEIMRRYGVSGILARESSQANRLMGILTNRDILAAGNNDRAMVWDFMTPFKKMVWAEPGISMEEAEKLMLEKRVEKLPLIDQHRRICGLITLKDIRLSKQKPYAVRDVKGRLRVGAAIGASKDYLERAKALIVANVDFIVMDIAHAHSGVIWKAVSEFRAKFGDFPLVCGNVATCEGAEFLMNLGVDGIKVGIGPGTGCLTRLETGAGVPQIQAIREVYKVCQGKTPIMADGGIKKDKDVTLALLVGADTVMVGSMFAGTDETPGEIITIQGKKFKYYRGMTSPEAVLAGMEEGETAEEVLATPAEGKESKVEFKGSVVDIITRIRGHLCSAVSYAGKKSLEAARRRFSENPNLFIELSEASKKESFDR